MDCQEPMAEIEPTGAQAAMAPDASWVVVGKFENNSRARAAKDGLDSSNIPSMILPSDFHAAGSSLSVDSSRSPRSEREDQIKIMAPREFEIEASLILQALAQAQAKAFGSGKESDTV
jgi:hypothetical protein